jgi:hypothetical protein
MEDEGYQYISRLFRLKKEYRNNLWHQDPDEDEYESFELFYERHIREDALEDEEVEEENTRLIYKYLRSYMPRITHTHILPIQSLSIIEYKFE